MRSFYVNRQSQPSGEHEVHVPGCSWFPSEANARYLGRFASCTAALDEARKYYARVDGCAHCLPACHTG